MIRTTKEVAWRGEQNVMKELEKSERKKWVTKKERSRNEEKID